MHRAPVWHALAWGTILVRKWVSIATVSGALRRSSCHAFTGKLTQPRRIFDASGGVIASAPECHASCFRVRLWRETSPNRWC